jgi:uncharacterized protein YjbI with pentapeptide repeats
METINNVIFTKATLGKNKYVSNINYVSCEFENCNFSLYTFSNCEFVNCKFYNCDYVKSFLALNSNNKSGKYISCFFDSCNLTSASFNFPIVEDCIFQNCILKETNFDGSRFSNSKFIGTLDSCFFRGTSKYSTKNSLSIFTSVLLK